MTPPSLERLIRALSRLPSVGKRSAERMALRIVQDPSGGLATELQAALAEAQRDIRLCDRCGYLTTQQQNPCRICADPGRDSSLLCLVEGIGDITLMEQANAFRGRYFCLVGKLSPATGQTLTPERLQALTRLIREEKPKELLLALNSDVESDATAAYLAEFLQGLPVKVTRLALGIPAGSGIRYADPLTLARAVNHRQRIHAGGEE